MSQKCIKFQLFEIKYDSKLEKKQNSLRKEYIPDCWRRNEIILIFPNLESIYDMVSLNAAKRCIACGIWNSKSGGTEVNEEKTNQTPNPPIEPYNH